MFQPIIKREASLLPSYLGCTVGSENAELLVGWLLATVTELFPWFILLIDDGLLWAIVVGVEVAVVGKDAAVALAPVVVVLGGRFVVVVFALPVSKMEVLIYLTKQITSFC